ncbi:unnamed protein product [Colias eurytheme]|nr:unnamed protein product [Colias eurytheme]
MAVADAYLNDETELTPEYREMKTQIRKLWANFVTTGMPVPNATEFPSWPACKRRKDQFGAIWTLMEKCSNFLVFLMPKRPQTLKNLRLLFLQIHGMTYMRQSITKYYALNRIII